MNDVRKATTARAQSLARLEHTFVRLLFLTAALLLLCTVLPSKSAAQSTPPAPEMASLILKLAAGLSADEQAAVIAQNGGIETSTVPALRLHVVEVAADQLDQALAGYRADPRVVRAEVNKVRQSNAMPSDPFYSQQWALPRIGWDLVFGNSMPGGSVVVAVLDTGVDGTHPDLSGNIVPGTSILDGSNGLTDPSGHGTMVAGTVAARTNTAPAEGIAGVAYAGVRLMPVTVLDADGLGQDSDVIAGVIWAVEHGANVILMAFSNPGFSESLQEAIDYAWANNVILVAAAGNDALGTPTYPAGDRGVIGVSATDENDALAPFSNYGPSVFLAAPGTSILTTDIGNTYLAVSGTSTSAAIVAGAAAQLMAIDPTRSNGVIVGRLARTADPAGTQEQTGNGRINLARALADTAIDFIQPIGVAPVGTGGPFVGPYRAAGSSTISGTVTDTSNNPIAGATITCPNTSCNNTSTTTTAPNGTYTLPVQFGGNSNTVSLTAAATGFTPQTASVAVSNSTNPTRNFTLARVNTAPSASNQSVTTNEDTAKVITLAASDAEGNALTFSIVGNPTHGTLSAITGTTCTGTPSSCSASVTYTPAANYNGADSFTFKANDGTVDSAAATVSITVTFINDAPQAANDAYNTNEDAPLVVAAPGVLANDSDIDSAVLTATLVSAPTHALSFALNANGSFSYTPVANYNGTDSFTYKANDGGLDSAVATVTITVNPVNDAPVAADQSVTTNEDSPQTIALSGSDFDSAALTFGVVSAPSHGSLGSITGTTCTAVSNSTGTPGTACTANVTYTPAANYNGADSFTFKVNDGSLDSGAATVSITITPVDDAPVAVDDTYNTNEDTQLVIGVPGILTNDTDVDSPSVTAVLVSGPTHAADFTLNPDGSFSYTPVANYNGPDSFTYKASDGAEESNVATVSITVNAVDDAPVATNDVYSTDEDTPLSVAAPGVLGNDNDIDTPPSGWTALLVSGPSHASSFTLNADGSFSYTPAPNYNGTDTFTYKPNDGTVDGNVAMVTITVLAVNDVTLAINDTYTTDEDTPLAVPASAGVLANDVDPDTGETLLVELVNPPVHASAFTLNPDGSFDYTPAADFNGSDTFTYRVNDQGQYSNTAMVNITINPVNDAPVAASQSAETDEDVAKTITLSAFDIDSTSLTFSIVDSPVHGTLGSMPSPTCSTVAGVTTCTVDVAYTPAADYNGADSLTFKTSDGSLDSNIATVSITVNAVNDPPVANSGSATTDEDTSVTIKLSAYDIDSPDLTFMIGPAGAGHGTLSAISGTTCTPSGDGATCTAYVTYTPAANYNGPDTFKFAVRDGNLQSTPATISITVNAVNDAPVASGQSASTAEDTPKTIVLSASDVDSTTLTFGVVAGPSHGSLGAPSSASCTTVTNGTGTPGSTCTASVTYTPALDYNGPDSFTFKVNDGALDSNTATVYIGVTPVNDPPANVSANATPTTINENGSVTVSGAFTDPDVGDTHSVVIRWGDGSADTTLMLAAGVFSYSATHQYLDDSPTGTASDVNGITVTVTDQAGVSGSGSTAVTVNNLAPIITSLGGPVDPIALGGMATVSATFTDVGSQDTHSCTFRWNDGTPDTVIGAPGTGSGSCSATHTYATSNVYPVDILVTDDDTGSATSSYQYAVIYDARNGFVTGGGWINSPPGAYAANATLAGKANFGFVSKYQKGANVPTGNTEFQFQTANFNFKSTEYEWLVIAGAKAQYKGSGTINGQGDYGFLLTAIDGSVNGGGGIDKLRLKVWDKSTGNVIYDNQTGAAETADPTTALGGGSVVIHK